MAWDFAAAHLSILYEMADVFLIFFLLILFAGSLIARFDNLPFGKAVYFSFITAFTVGYGDITPQSRKTRVVAVCLSLLGLVLMGIMVGVASQALNIVYSEIG